jgi:hypothetical protein
MPVSRSLILAIIPKGAGNNQSHEIHIPVYYYTKKGRKVTMNFYPTHFKVLYLYKYRRDMFQNAHIYS